MKILVAPDSFKGSITSVEFCDVTEKAIKDIKKDMIMDIDVIKIPMADGGEGTIESIVRAMDGITVKRTVSGPLGDDVEALFGITGDKSTGVIELAQASGLTLVPKDKRNPMFTTTYGTGQLIKEALEYGCRRIIIGLGGSATNDGGVGLLSALGIRFLNKKGENISAGAKGLLELESVDMCGIDKRLASTELLVLCDVDNPLYGKNGAGYVYGPQKGADPDTVKEMDAGLRNFAKKTKKYLDKDIAQEKYAGAAGGAAAGLMAYLDAKLVSGAEIIKELTGFNKTLGKRDIDLVITGEGEVNFQTAFGKLPISVAKEARKYGTPVVAVVGRIGKGAYAVHAEGICSIFSIINGPMTLEDACKNGKQLLYEAIGEIIRFYCSNKRANFEDFLKETQETY